MCVFVCECVYVLYMCTDVSQGRNIYILTVQAYKMDQCYDVYIVYNGTLGMPNPTGSHVTTNSRQRGAR